MKSVTMRSLTFAGALVTAFVLGGITTLWGIPRTSPSATSTTHAAATISPEEPTRGAARPLPEFIYDGYY
jgi:hypothetical protein